MRAAANRFSRRYRLVLVPEEDVRELPVMRAPGEFSEQMLMVDSHSAIQVTPNPIERGPSGFRKITVSRLAFDTMFEIVD
jgi:hypothetical protein